MTVHIFYAEPTPIAAPADAHIDGSEVETSNAVKDDVKALLDSLALEAMQTRVVGALEGEHLLRLSFSVFLDKKMLDNVLFAININCRWVCVNERPKLTIDEL